MEDQHKLLLSSWKISIKYYYFHGRLASTIMIIFMEDQYKILLLSSWKISIKYYYFYGRLASTVIIIFMDKYYYLLYISNYLFAHLFCRVNFAWYCAEYRGATGSFIVVFIHGSVNLCRLKGPGKEQRTVRYKNIKNSRFSMEEISSFILIY